MTTNTNVNVTPALYTRGQAQIRSYLAGAGAVDPYGAHFGAYAVLAIQMERIVHLQSWRVAVLAGKYEAIPPAELLWRPRAINIDRVAAYAHQMGLGDSYLAVRSLARGLVARSCSTPRGVRTQQVAGLLGSPRAGAQLAQVPSWSQVLVVTFSGIAGAAATIYNELDKRERQTRIQIEQVHATASVTKYLAAVEAAIISGQPIPQPPPIVTTLAAQEREYPYWAMGVGAVLAGAAALGVWSMFRRTPARSNPAPFRRRAARSRALPVRRRRASGTRRGRTIDLKRSGTKRRPNPKKRPAPKRVASKSNPLARGHSKATVSKNVARLRREGRPAGVAAAAALRSARTAWRKGHPRGAFPGHLQTQAERAGRTNPHKAPPKKKAAPKRPGPKKRAPKKAAPKRKPNPRKKAITKTSFISKQRRSGRSDRQAAADWKGRQRLKANRRKSSGKARRRK